MLMGSGKALVATHTLLHTVKDVELCMEQARWSLDSSLPAALCKYVCLSGMHTVWAWCKLGMLPEVLHLCTVSTSGHKTLYTAHMLQLNKVL